MFDTLSTYIMINKDIKKLNTLQLTLNVFVGEIVFREEYMQLILVLLKKTLLNSSFHVDWQEV